ncbi:WD40 repeat domain-containing protein, partial [Cyanobacteria bacterium FACHB-63]|nr:WD40 repeat domain-containing protein [Cyanobacteria bacterium FACHB-63]
LVPIVYRDGFQQMHEALARHNWLFFRESDNFDRGFEQLINAIEMDLEYVRSHTRLLERAIEWEGKKRNDSFLLRGSVLEEAETWLRRGAGKQPQPTGLQGEYIDASRKLETEQHKKEARQRRIFTIGIGVFALLACGAAAVAFYQQQIALAEKKKAEQQSKMNLVRQVATEAFTKEKLGNIPGLIRFNLDENRTEAKVGLAVVADRLPPHLRQLQFKIIRLKPDERSTVLVTTDGKAFFIDENKNARKIPGQEIINAGFTANRKKDHPSDIIITERTGRMRRFSSQDMRELDYSQPSRNVTGTAFDPDGLTFAIASSDGNVRVSYGRDTTVLDHIAPVNSVTFDSSGQYILTASGNEAHVWAIDRRGVIDIESKQIAKLSHSTPVRFAVFTEDGSIATVTENIVIRLFTKCDYINNNIEADEKDKRFCNNQSYLDILDATAEFVHRIRFEINFTILLFIIFMAIKRRRQNAKKRRQKDA